MTKTIETIGVKVLNRSESEAAQYIDFEIYVNGEAEAVLYRQYYHSEKFQKILGINTYGRAIRGNARKAAQALVNDLIKNKANFAIKLFN